MLSQKRDDLVAVVVDPRFFAKGVVAAGDGDFAVFDVVFFERGHRVAGQIDRET